MNDKVPFHIIVALSVEDEGEVAAVVAALHRMRNLCKSEPGCLEWEAYQSRDHPEDIFLVEKWETRSHWEAHGEMAAIKEIYVPVILPRITREVLPVTPVIDPSQL